MVSTQPDDHDACKFNRVQCHDYKNNNVMTMTLSLSSMVGAVDLGGQVYTTAGLI